MSDKTDGEAPVDEEGRVVLGANRGGDDVEGNALEELVLPGNALPVHRRVLDAEDVRLTGGLDQVHVVGVAALEPAAELERAQVVALLDDP